MEFIEEEYAVDDQIDDYGNEDFIADNEENGELDITEAGFLIGVSRASDEAFEDDW